MLKTVLKVFYTLLYLKDCVVGFLENLFASRVNGNDFSFSFLKIKFLPGVNYLVGTDVKQFVSLSSQRM